MSGKERHQCVFDGGQYVYFIQFGVPFRSMSDNWLHDLDLTCSSSSNCSISKRWWWSAVALYLATSNKQQATSNKQQAKRNKQQATSNKQEVYQSYVSVVPVVSVRCVLNSICFSFDLCWMWCVFQFDDCSVVSIRCVFSSMCFQFDVFSIRCVFNSTCFQFDVASVVSVRCVFS
jgi:hypothetical protein